MALAGQWRRMTGMRAGARGLLMRTHALETRTRDASFTAAQGAAVFDMRTTSARYFLPPHFAAGSLMAAELAADLVHAVSFESPARTVNRLHYARR
jgi:hypothetical protein